MREFKVVDYKHRKHLGDIQLPTQGTKKSAGYDFYSPVDVTIEPNEMKLIFTDVCADCMDEGEVLMLYVRSSMGIKNRITLANGTGVVDADYRDADNGGNIGIALVNNGNSTYHVKAGDRIAQGIFFNYLKAANGSSDTERTGGFGSTGTK